MSQQQPAVFHETYGPVTIVAGGFIGPRNTPFVTIRDRIGTEANVALADLTNPADRVAGGHSMALYRSTLHRESLS